MIFLDLTLQNFGPYGGRHRLNLRPHTVGNAHRPIILIGGLNGGGKTTLMDALRLVLYGQRAQCSNRGTLAYADFLNQINQAIDRTKKDLATYSQLAIDLKNTDHLLQSAAKVKQTLAIFKQKLKLHKLNHLEDLVTKHFLYLLRKPDFVHRVQIDTDTLRLSLYDHNGDLIFPKLATRSSCFPPTPRFAPKK
ncbi:AAA family ATPase [Nodosilinea sp. E11]|uniref:AAA family ATPase n=1 Tax=Nodosilinea sp. E11 TaxID=3037479 RepID=UPI0029342546|nr:AAA family ATPase [Nodosilinea sp. E11]WOD40333.1 AAA family ATPase [Nodosilinea sp. E11]